jgi:hypothetical protein
LWGDGRSRTAWHGRAGPGRRSTTSRQNVFGFIPRN